MTYPTRKNLVVTVSPTPYAAPLLLKLAPAGVRFFVGIALSGVSFVASGGAGGPYTYTISTGTLPAGVSLNSSTGALTGTPTTQGQSVVIAQVQDSASNTFQHSFALNVESGLFPVNGHTTPPDGANSTPYSFQVLMADATGSTSGITYSVVSGSLPASLSLNGTTGYITGTPSVVGTSYFTIRGTKGSVSLDEPMSIRIRRALSTAAVTIPTTLRNMTLGIPVSDSLTYDAFGVAPITFSLTSGSLPTGLSLNSKGVISGTPSAVTATTYTQPTITLTDANGATLAFTPSGSNVFNVGAAVKPAASGNFVVIDPSGAPTTTDFMTLFFGDGSDGDVTIDGSTGYTFFLPLSGGVNRASRNIYANNVTISGSGILEIGGDFVLHVAGVLDITNAQAGAIRNRSDGLTWGMAGGAHGNGATTTGGNGTAAPVPTYAAGGKGIGGGGQGGHGDSTNSGGSSPGTGGIGQQVRPRSILEPAVTARSPGFVVAAVRGGTGGSGGGGGGGNGTLAGGNGGDGGTGGDVIRINARTINRGSSTPAGIIDASGVDGANGSNATGLGNKGGGGAGAGGAGGFVIMAYMYLQGTTVTNAIDVSGGKGGNGGNRTGASPAANGAGGDGANGGRIVLQNVLDGTTSFVDGGTASFASGQTGGAGGVCQSDL